MLNRIIQLFSDEPKKIKTSGWSEFKVSTAIIVAIILLSTTIFLWSTIKLIFLSSIGYIFTYIAIKYRAEGRNFLVASVIGLIVSFVILVQFSTPLIAELGKSEAPVIEVLEEDQNMFERMLSKLEEPDEPDEPTLFEKYTPLVIIFNIINLFMLSFSVFSSQRVFVKTAQQFNIRVADATTGPDNSITNE